MKKILLSVAPVEAIRHKIDQSALVEDILKCSELGTSMVHLHVRDENACLTEAPEFTNRIIEEIRKYSNIIIEISTGGVSDLTIEQRCVCVSEDMRIEAHSLNVGSVNLGEQVYINSPKDVVYCINKIKQYRKKAEVEVFELGHIYTTRELAKKYGFSLPVWFSVVLGHEGAAPAEEKVLKYMVQYIKSSFKAQDAIWGITHAHRTNFELINTAIAMGAETVRLGFEDSGYGSKQQEHYNWEIIKEFKEVCQNQDTEFMSADEARSLLNIM